MRILSLSKSWQYLLLQNKFKITLSFWRVMFFHFKASDIYLLACKQDIWVSCVLESNGAIGCRKMFNKVWANHPNYYSVHPFLLKTYLRDKTKIYFHGKNKSISRDFNLPLHKQIHINAVQLIEFILISPDEDLSVEALDNIKVCRDL